MTGQRRFRSGAGILHAPMLVLLAAGLAACVPSPHIEHLRPAATGVVLEDGKPVPGVELFLGKFPGNNQPCTDVHEVVPVSPEGSFSWASIQESKLTDSVINPVALRGTITALCIRHPAKGILIGAMLAMRQNRALSLRLACDVARPRNSPGLHRITAWLGQNQYCEAKET